MNENATLCPPNDQQYLPLAKQRQMVYTSIHWYAGR